MTNFELITQNPQTLEDFLCAVQDDALEAEGCSLELKLPPVQGAEQIVIGWKDWLTQEAVDETIYLASGRTIERWRKWGEDDE